MVILCWSTVARVWLYHDYSLVVTILLCSSTMIIQWKLTIIHNSHEHQLLQCAYQAIITRSSFCLLRHEHMAIKPSSMVIYHGSTMVISNGYQLWASLCLAKHFFHAPSRNPAESAQRSSLVEQTTPVGFTFTDKFSPVQSLGDHHQGWRVGRAGGW